MQHLRNANQRAYNFEGPYATDICQLDTVQPSTSTKINPCYIQQCDDTSECEMLQKVAEKSCLEMTQESSDRALIKSNDLQIPTVSTNFQHDQLSQQQRRRNLARMKPTEGNTAGAGLEFISAEFRARQYACSRYIGCGSFGIVVQAINLKTGDQVAIKRVDQDPRYKNRELDIMKKLNHPNTVQLLDYFYEEYKRLETNEVRRKLNVVMDYVPDTVYRVLRAFNRNDRALPMILVRLYTYQLCRSIAYLHSLQICHRDIKPQNLLVDPQSHVLKLCDFGSAKRLVQSEYSVAYICSRFYRAPELMLGATGYTVAIDLWSIGCVLGELLLGRPLFSGETAVDQLVKIIRVLGTPTKQQMLAMNPNYEAYRFPKVSPVPWSTLFQDAMGNHTESLDDAILLLSMFLEYEPEKRIPAFQALTHPFFDPLRDPNCRLHDQEPLPKLFDFTPEELALMTPEDMEKLIPEWYAKRDANLTAS